MNWNDNRVGSGEAEGCEVADVEAVGYEPPAIRRLGSLAELTQGGTTTIADGYGGAGANGSI